MYTHTISTVFKEPLPWHVWTGVCVKMSQNLTVVSPEPLATWQPSGLKLTDITASAWPGKELQVTQNTVHTTSLKHLMQQCPIFLAICQSPYCRLVYGPQWKKSQWILYLTSHIIMPLQYTCNLQMWLQLGQLCLRGSSVLRLLQTVSYVSLLLFFYFRCRTAG